MATILITGGTGLVGKAVSQLLIDKGHDVIVLSRGQATAAKDHYRQAHWDPDKGLIDVAAVQQSDFIINLAGAGVADKRWSKKRKQEIIDSRVRSGELLVKTLKENDNQVKAVISASGIGWYGGDEKRPRDKAAFTETDPVDQAFLGKTCELWEGSVAGVKELPGKRLVIFRIGVALSKQGGAFKEFMKPVRFGVATIFGHGRQVISWIHIDDLARLFLFAIENQQVDGVYNAVASQPVTNKNFMLKLAEKVKGRFYIPFYVPSFVLKMVVGGLSIEVLKSATVSNTKISQAGFQFLYPTIEPALTNLTKK
ncbi:TIGR01777 family oxidoreductase [Paraflavitalea pollutisoli]|uniref:TIGR01777 family oxidoreductase n=1 Tax=Paraflavitalea pollutisoli TaxID=3034143 RepID=UPI0023EBE6FE|nr:TIGR01777 family oxidoreductase [Paraflavitalea sp. H1-2-19X]